MLLDIHLTDQFPQPGVNNANGSLPIRSLFFTATKRFAIELEVAVVQRSGEWVKLYMTRGNSQYFSR